MKSITRLSLALIMFSLFSISYLVTSVTAQDVAPGMAGQPAPGYLNNPGTAGAPGMAGQPAPGYLNNPGTVGAPGMAGTKALPGMGAPHMGAPVLHPCPPACD